MKSKNIFYKLTKHTLKLITIVLILLLLFIATNVLINLHVIFSTKGQIHSPEDVSINDSDTMSPQAIVVYGAGIYKDKPTPFLQERLDTAIDLYKKGLAPKIIMSGDHTGDHNEPKVMKNYAISQGIPSEDIFMDHHGYNSYATTLRAKEVFQVERAIFVTHEYHLYRTLYIAKSIGIDAIGVPCDSHKHPSTTTPLWQLREIFGRSKDFFLSKLQPDLHIKGQTIDLDSDGDITNETN